MAVLSVKERQELFSLSKYGAATGKKRSVLPSSLGVNARKEIQKVTNDNVNCHRREITRLNSNPELIKKDREYYEQTLFFADVYDEFPEAYKLLAAVPNGGFRKKAERWRLIASGTRAGWPDVQLLLPKQNFHGLFIEFKKPVEWYKTIGAAKSALQDHQINMLNTLKEAGYACFVAYGHNQAMCIIRACLSSDANVLSELELTVKV